MKFFVEWNNRGRFTCGLLENTLALLLTALKKKVPACVTFRNQIEHIYHILSSPVLRLPWDVIEGHRGLTTITTTTTTAHSTTTRQLSLLLLYVTIHYYFCAYICESVFLSGTLFIFLSFLK